MPIDWTLGDFVAVHIEPPLAEDELYELWDGYRRAAVNQPRLIFLADDDGVVSVALHPDEGALPVIERMGRAVARAVHLKHPDRMVDC